MLWENFRVALKSLRANKMRSFLTMLGIIIGVASLITMIAVGAGAQTKVAEQIRSFGANVLLVAPGAARDKGIRKESGSGHSLTEDDAEAIGTQLPEIRVIAPLIRGPGQVVHGSKNWSTFINGTTVNYFVARDWNLNRGRYFSKDEENGAGKVAIIGATIAKELFGTNDPVGQQIRISSAKQVSETDRSKHPRIQISSVPFAVIGVLAEKGSAGTGQNQDDVMFVPISTAKVRLMGGASQTNRDALSYVLAKAVSDEATVAATSAIESLLKQRHRLAADAENDFEVIDPAAIMAAQQAATTTIAWLLAAIASVSLAVGGIGIMNIMLVSVTERTREIGLRQAVGARRRDIRNQFLTEAISLCLLGGLIGVGSGAAAAWAIARLAGWPIYLGPEAALFAAGSAALVGIFFGYWPARKAATLEPVVALRTE